MIITKYVNSTSPITARLDFQHTNTDGADRTQMRIELLAEYSHARGIAPAELRNVAWADLTKAQRLDVAGYAIDRTIRDTARAQLRARRWVDAKNGADTELDE